MAGIGLRLRQIVAGGSYLEAAAAYLSSAVIMSGPWLSAVIGLALFGGASAAFLGTADRDLLFAVITYAFAASLIVTGGAQVVLTRYLADRFYKEETQNVAAIGAGVLLSAGPLALLAAPFVVFAPLDLRLRLLGATLFLTLALTWLIVVFLSATREYLRILIIFAGAYATSVGAGVGLGRTFGVAGALAGFTLGQALCLGLLVARVFREFAPAQGIDLAFLDHFRRFWDLGLIGLLYAVGLWADNLLTWFSPRGTLIGGYLHLAPSYDAAKLIAYLATVPASAAFIVHLEANFYRHYYEFFRLIRERGTLGQIAEARAGMTEAASSGLMAILTLQALVAAALVALAPRLATLLQEPPGWAPLFRVLVVGVSVQFMMLAIFILLLYLDQRGAALIVTLLFAGGNAGLTAVLAARGLPGVGYLVAAGAAALVGLVSLFVRLRQLEYLTFMKQPI